MYFCYFIIISPWKRVGPFIWTNLNPIHPRILCAKFGWNWLSGSGEEDFFNFVDVFSLFRNYPSLEKGRTLHLNKPVSPSLKDALCQVRLIFSQWLWRRFFFNSAISLSSALGKGRGPWFEQTCIPFTQRCFVPSLVEIGRVVLEKKTKRLKVYRQTDGQIDDERQAIRKLTWASAQVS